MNSVAAHEVGKASGTFKMLRELGGVFGIVILVAVFAETGSFAFAPPCSDGFARVIGVSAALTLVGAFAGVGLPGIHQRAFIGQIRLRRLATAEGGASATLTE